MGAQQSLQSMDLRTVGRRVMRRSRRSIAVGSSIALVAGMTSMVGGAAMATPSSATPQTVTSTSTVAPQSNNPACEPSTYVDVAAGYTYQAFTDLSICDFVVPAGITTIDYVVIAGGGSGGVGRGGGGGAGGMIVDDTVVNPGDTLTLDVGDGGPANGGTNPPGAAGQDSTLAGPGPWTITAVGGGGGGTWAGPNPPTTNSEGSPGSPGGSGGGASGGDDSSQYPLLVGGAGVAGQGNSGGRSSVPSVNNCTSSDVVVDSICAAGGGGGAGGVGLSGGQTAGVDDTFGGAGGPGLSVNWIDGTVARNLQIGDDSGGVPYFAGGGGGGVKQGSTSTTVQGIGGAGGVGGGGAGANTSGTPAGSGVAGTGGGGGGNEGPSGPAGKGGSGIIVLRYASAVIPQCNPSVVTQGADTIVTFAGVGVCEWAPPAGLDEIDFLLVGGGGGGGAAGGGGGGGGSLAEDTSVDISAAMGPLRITPGYGGLPGSNSASNGSAGAASTLQIGSTVYSAPGGSGGRSGVISNSGGAGGSGGDATAPGGAGGNGASTAASAGSPGTAGPSSSISGTAIVYAGGGGGGISTPNDGNTTVAAATKGPVSGGTRGGGAGPRGSWDTSNPGGSGLAGSGGGGGGGQTGGPYEGAGGRGGSGVVIIRYTQTVPVAPVISATPGNGTASIAWSVSNIGGSALTSVEFALDDTSNVYFTTTTVTSPTQLSGLTNGQTYTVYARVVNSVGTGPWSLPAQVTPVAPPVPAGPPTSVRAVAGNASAVVSWSPPATAGSFPVTTYRVTGQPGGQGCLVAAPTLRCTVTGLTNGTTYTFRVEALTGAGWSPAATSNPVTPGGVTPTPDPVPVPKPLTPGQSLLLVNGVPDTSVQVTPNSRENGLTIEGDDWSMDLDGLGPDGKPLNLGPNGALILNQQRQVQTTGRGFLASSDVNLYIDPPVQTTQTSSVIQGSALATGIYVGTLRTTRAGTFEGVVTLPADVEPGERILQVVGTGPSGDQRAMNLGVIVAPWITLDQGTRKAQGRHDRIRTGGDTGGFEAGTRLTPWIRYSDQDEFRQGRATIRVQSDGSFTWTRKIRANRGLTAYVSFTETESNRVFWKKVR